MQAPLILCTGQIKFINCFRLPSCPIKRRRPCFRPTLVPGQTQWAPTPVFGLSSLASVSPSGQKPRIVPSVYVCRGGGIWIGGRGGQKGLEEERELGRSRPCFFSQPRSPSLPSPARHLSRPDNGSSAEGACAVRPGPSSQREQGIPGGDARPPGWSRKRGMRAARDAQARARRGPWLQRGCLRSQMSPSSLNIHPSNSAEATPTVGSVLPIVLHDRSGQGGEAQPARPQPRRAGGSAGSSAPPRAPAPPRLPAWSAPPPPAPSNGSPAPEGAWPGGGPGLRRGETQPLFPGWCA
jgi:hypothetical protein